MTYCNQLRKILPTHRSSADIISYVDTLQNLVHSHRIKPLSPPCPMPFLIQPPRNHLMPHRLLKQHPKIPCNRPVRLNRHVPIPPRPLSCASCVRIYGFPSSRPFAFAAANACRSICGAIPCPRPKTALHRRVNIARIARADNSRPRIHGRLINPPCFQHVFLLKLGIHSQV